MEKNTNKMGKTGFALSLIFLFLGWIPIIGWLGSFLAFIFSFIGLFRAPRGKAIAGLLISTASFFEIWLILAFWGSFLFGLIGLDYFC